MAASGCSINAGGEVKCRQQTTAPLSATQVLNVAQAHGYEMGSRESDVLCKSANVSSYLTNAVDASKSPSPNVHAYGHVTCLVETAPTLDTAARVTIRPQDDKTTAYVDNVKCIHYTDGNEDDAERQRHVFEDFANALARSA